MTREEFIGILEEKGYSYKIDGDKLVVTKNGNVVLRGLKTLPSGVEFKNGGAVYLRTLETLSPGVVFKNEGNVHLDLLETLPPGVEFKNEGAVDLTSLETIPPGVVFENVGGVYLESLVGDWFEDWKGNIKGIDNKRLLNLMISKRVFEK